MGIYLLYIVITFLAYNGILGDHRAYRLRSGRVVQRDRIIFSWIAGTLLWAIFAFRDISVGSDTINYYYRYINIQKPSLSLVGIAGQELGYDMLQYLCRSIGMGWQVYLAVVSAIIIAPMVLLFHRYSVNIWASFFLYVTIGLINVNMSAIRQSLAVAMVVMSIISIFDKQYIGLVVYVLIGSLFHYSAIFALLLAFIPLYRCKSKLHLTYLLLVPFIARIAGDIFLGSILSLMPTRYMDFYTDEQIMNPLLEAVWISLLLFLYFTHRVNGKVKFIDFRFYLLVVLFVASVELSYSVYLASRLSYYFELAVMVAIPNAILKYKDKTTRMIISVGVYSLCLAFLIVSSLGSDTLAIYDYKFFWQ